MDTKKYIVQVRILKRGWANYRSNLSVSDANVLVYTLTRTSDACFSKYDVRIILQD